MGPRDELSRLVACGMPFNHLSASGKMNHNGGLSFWQIVLDVHNETSCAIPFGSSQRRLDYMLFLLLNVF
jgi:hypothetical protein